jgi:hypothetical protein
LINGWVWGACVVDFLAPFFAFHASTILLTPSFPLTQEKKIRWLICRFFFSPFVWLILLLILSLENRGKRPLPPIDSTDPAPETEDFPYKKVTITPEADSAKRSNETKAQGSHFSDPQATHADITFQQSATRPRKPSQLASR